MSFEIPGFSTEQVASLIKLMEEMLDRAFEKHFGPLPPQQKQAVIMPKSAQPQEQKQEHKSLPQTIAEDNAESTAESISSIASNRPDHTSLLPTIPRLRTMSTYRESTSCLSTARIHYTPNLAPLFASQYASLLALVSPLSYIRHAKEMEPTGQG